MMGMHGPTVTVVPTLLRSAFLLLKKEPALSAPEDPFVQNDHVSTMIFHLPFKDPRLGLATVFYQFWLSARSKGAAVCISPEVFPM